MSFTQVIALIGCITGIISLSLGLIRSWNERFYIRVSFIEAENMFFHRLSRYSNYQTEYQGLLRVRFENRSSSPVTVFSASASVNGEALHIQEYQGGLGRSFILSLDEKKSREILMDKELLLPIRIDSYDAVEGYMFISFFPSISDDTAPLKFSINTTKKDLTVFSHIHYVGRPR